MAENKQLKAELNQLRIEQQQLVNKSEPLQDEALRLTELMAQTHTELSHKVQGIEEKLQLPLTKVM